VNKNLQVLVISFIVIFVLLFLRLLHLQIADGAKFNRLALENAAKTVPESAPRGIIYDRQGKVLVENRPVFSVRILPYVLNKKSPAEQKRILDLLATLLGEKIELKVSAVEPILVKDDIVFDIAIKVEERGQELEGVIATSQPVRLFKYGNLAAHVLGYVGEIEANELSQLKDQGYRQGDIVGKDGVEKIYDQFLRGTNGGKRVEVDVYGTPLRILESIEPTPGADMQLTLDTQLQQVAESALGQQEGAVVVMQAKTGEILALASYPNYDPNLFISGFKHAQWAQMNGSRHPFINRALAIYPPGSIFKVVTLAAALEEGVASIDEVLDCHGYYKLHNRLAKCWLASGHGPISVLEGLVWSCDVVYYELGRRLGPDKLAKYARKFGLGSKTGLDLPQEKKGTVPDTAWKKSYLGQNWYDGDSINYGIGQGFIQVTPLQMACLYASLSSGKLVRPYIVKEIRDQNNQLIYQGTTEVVSELGIAPKTLLVIRQALREVIRRGTGVAANIPGIPVAGKTGTAENPGLAHAWFICYAPFDNPEIVIASFVAHGEHGDRASAYIARDILRWYEKERLAQPYPPEEPEAQYILHGSRKVPYGNFRRPVLPTTDNPAHL